MTDVKFFPAGDCAMVVEFGTTIAEEINDKVYWRLANCDVPVKYIDFADGGTVFFFETVFPGLDQKEAFELWKQQLCYTYQKDLKFEEING